MKNSNSVSLISLTSLIAYGAPLDPSPSQLRSLESPTTTAELYEAISTSISGVWRGTVSGRPSETCELSSFKSQNGVPYTQVYLDLPSSDGNFPQGWAFQDYDVTKAYNQKAIAIAGPGYFVYRLHQYDGSGELNPTAKDYYLELAILDNKLNQFRYRWKNQHISVIKSEKTCENLEKVGE